MKNTFNTGKLKNTFNTGKIEIGKYYEPPRRFESSLDMDRLQRALLNRSRGVDRKSVTTYVTLATAVLGLAVLLR